LPLLPPPAALSLLPRPAAPQLLAQHPWQLHAVLLQPVELQRQRPVALQRRQTPARRLLAAQFLRPLAWPLLPGQLHPAWRMQQLVALLHLLLAGPLPLFAAQLAAAA
jgi:hypothetical protein